MNAMLVENSLFDLVVAASVLLIVGTVALAVVCIFVNAKPRGLE